MTFDENVADREPPQLGGFFIWLDINCRGGSPWPPVPPTRAATEGHPYSCCLKGLKQ